MSTTTRATFIQYLYSAEEASSRDEIYSGTTIWLKIGSNSIEQETQKPEYIEQKPTIRKTQVVCVGV